MYKSAELCIRNTLYIMHLYISVNVLNECKILKPNRSRTFNKYLSIYNNKAHTKKNSYKYVSYNIIVVRIISISYCLHFAIQYD